MTRRFNLTPRAKADLRNIWRYTYSHWGEEKADLYLSQLYSRFEWLSQQPQAGKHRPDICEGYYYFPQGSHLVFYLIRESEIDIIGIVHKRMDVLNYFDKDGIYE